MIDTESFIKLLKENFSVDHFVGVPCSNIKSLINYAENNGIYVEAPNEGEAIAYSCGAMLSGKVVPIMMQNSGFANSLNAITSLLRIYKMPSILLIGHRGMNGKGTDEPQHEIMGQVTEKWLKDCGFKVFYAKNYENAEKLIIEMSKVNESEDIDEDGCIRPIAVLFDKKDLSKVECKSDDSLYENTPLSRDDVIQEIGKLRDENTAVIATTGFTGRSLYEKCPNDGNFYMVGSMGHALSFGLGVAKNSNKKVIVLDGDGAVMMRPQGGIMMETLKCDNILHIILDNGLYESTGGQFVPGSRSDYNIAEMEMGIHQGGNKVAETNDINTVRDVVSNFVSNNQDMFPIKVLVVRINPKLNNNELGRPKESSYELAMRFYKFMNKDLFGSKE